jgi:C_GCAxxG_C_C family probable redox protein
MSRVEKAVADFRQGFTCSQAVLAAFSDQFGLGRMTALKIAGGFGGGIGRTAGTCGAVTGAVMVLGLKYSATQGDDREAKENTHRMVREFIERFTGRNNSIVCKELLGCDISTPEGFKTAHDREIIRTICPGLVSCAVELAEEMIR